MKRCEIIGSAAHTAIPPLLLCAMLAAPAAGSADDPALLGMLKKSKHGLLDGVRGAQCGRGCG